MRLLIILIFILTLFSCTKKDAREIQLPSTKQEAMDVYKDALNSMEEGQFLMASEKMQLTSARFVKEVAYHKGNIKPFVPRNVLKKFNEKLKEKNYEI